MAAKEPSFSWTGMALIVLALMLVAYIAVTLVQDGRSQLQPCASCAEPQIGMHVPHAPVYATFDGTPALAYELYLSNSTSAQGISRIDVLENGSSGRVLKTVQGDELQSSMRPPARGISEYVLFLWVNLSQGEKPASLYHKVYSAASVSQPAAEGAPTPVNYSAVRTISPPLRGDGWLAANGPSNLVGHRRAVFLGLSGAPAISQRYAIDYMQYGPDGRLFRTDGGTVEDYYCYGADILAVADGVVADAKDGIPDNAPGELPKLALANVGGNYVVLDIGGGDYAFYAHMIPGSQMVKIGDKVKKGDVLGRLGSSGNSDAPHLHFHLMRGRDALFSEGVPYTYDSCEMEGANPDWDHNSFGPNNTFSAWLPTPSALNGAMPVDGDIIGFPQSPEITNLTRVGAFEGGVKYTTANGKFPVLDLRGTYREMGRQYGYLMRDELQEMYPLVMADLNSRGISNDTIGSLGKSFYGRYTERPREILAGMSETSGLTLEQHQALNVGVIGLASAYLESVGCSGVAFWGNYSMDGKLYFGRNWDMSPELLGPYMEYLTLAVYHPDGGGNAVANLEFAGEVYTETAMNDKGVFLELNNGGQADASNYGGRAPVLVKLLDFMFDASDLGGMDRQFNTTLASNSYAIQVADKSAAYSYEWATFGVRRRSENVSGLLVAYNSFVPPYPAEWQGKVVPAPAAADDGRRENLLSLANSPKYKGKMDARLMQEFLSVKYQDGGGLVPGNTLQVIAVPEDFTIWIHGQNYSGWEQVDLKPLFG